MHGLTLLLLLAAAASTPSLDARFAELCGASPDRYPGLRAELLGQAGVAAFLQARAAEAKTAHERAIAGALVRRLRAPGLARSLDHWAPSQRALARHAPEHAAGVELGRVFAGEPDLAYERLFAAPATKRPSYETPAGHPSRLLAVVASGHEDAFARLEALLPRYQDAAYELANLDPARAVTPILAAMAREQNPDKKAAHIWALGMTRSRRADVRAELRRLLHEEGTVAQAAEALAKLRDRGAVEELVSLLGSNERSWVFEALDSIVGPAERGRRIDALATSPKADFRLRAACALEMGNAHDYTRRADALAALAGDRDPAVRLRALRSLWGVAGDHAAGFSPRVEAAVLRALDSQDTEERRLAANVLATLVPGHRPARPVVQSAALRAVTGTDKELAENLLPSLDRFFGESTPAVLILLDDLGYVSRKWPGPDLVAKARARLPEPGRSIRALASKPIPQLRELVQTWRQTRTAD
ncbi:MAG: hypothetical protein JXP73_22295 [Deltaproteobacteria bacterium]|nr:hypothetical protein [Deltaproteobacteria bacterium]